MDGAVFCRILCIAAKKLRKHTVVGERLTGQEEECPENGFTDGGKKVGQGGFRVRNVFSVIQSGQPDNT